MAIKDGMWVPDSKAAVVSPEQITDLTPDESIFSKLVTGAVDVGGTLFYPLNYAAAATRKLTGGVLGTKPTGEETYPGLGNVPSGQDIARQALGMRPNNTDSWELTDIPGIVADLALDPTMYIGVGELSAAGKLAKSASKLSAKIEARAASNLPAVASDVARLAELEAKLTAQGAAPRFAKTLGNQARAGQRSAVSFGLPFTQGIPLVRGAGALDQVGRFGRTVGGPIGKLYDQIGRPQGEIGTASAEAFNPLVAIQKDSARLAAFDAQKAADDLRRAVKGRVDDSIAKQISADVRKEVQWQSATKLGSNLNYPGSRAAKDAWSKFDITEGLDEVLKDQGATNTILELGNQVDDVMSVRTPAAIADWTAKLNAGTAILDKRIADARAAGNTASVFALQGAKTKLARGIADRIAIQQARGEVSQVALDSIKANSPDLYQLVEKNRAMMDDSLAKSRAAGVRAPSLADAQLSYLPRRVTLEGAEWAKTQKDPIFERMARAFSAESAFTKQRDRMLEGMSSFQIEQQAKAAGFKGQSFLVHSVPDLIQQRLLEGGIADANARFLGGAVDRTAISANLAGPGAMKVEDFLERAAITKVKSTDLINPRTGKIARSAKGIRSALKGTPYENLMIPADVANAALAMNEKLALPGFMQKIVDFTDSLHSAIRFGVTQIWPAYLARNDVNDRVLMAMAGMAPTPENLALNVDSLKIVQRVRSGKGTAADLQWVRDGVEFAAMNTGMTTEGTQLARGKSLYQRGADALGGVSKRIGGDRLKAATDKVTGAALDVGDRAQRLNQLLEDSRKLALYRWAIKQGKSASEAGDMVKKYLLDYGDLSTFEKQVVRRMAFFYTYQRKIIPTLLEESLKRPYTLRAYGSAMGYTPGSLQSQLLPANEYQQGKVATGQDAEGNQTFTRFDLPQANLFQFGSEGKGLSRMMQKFGTQLAPALRAPVEMLTQTNLQSGRPLQGATEDALLSLLPTSRGTNFVNRLRQTFDPETGNVTKRDDFLKSLVGMPQTSRLEPEQAARYARSEQIRRALERYRQKGRAKAYTNYGAVENDENVKALLSMLAQNTRQK